MLNPVPNIVIITPYVSLFIGAVFHLLLFLIRLVIPEEFKPENQIIRFIFRFIQSIFMGIYGALSLICIYASVTWIGGALGYVDIWYHIPSVILGLIIGVEYFLGVFLAKGSRSLLVIGLLAIGGICYLFIFYVPPFDRLSGASLGVAYVVGGIIVLIILWSILDELIGQKLNYPPLWTYNSDFYKKKMWIVDLILWILIIIELLFKIIGTSMIQYWFMI
jgi:hypothetical protein